MTSIKNQISQLTSLTLNKDPSKFGVLQYLEISKSFYIQNIVNILNY